MKLPVLPFSGKPAVQSRIELLSSSTVSQHVDIVNGVEEVRRLTDCSFGWNYSMDVPWVIANSGVQEGMIILDAGCGNGVFQWYASLLGAKVIAVDRNSESLTPQAFQQYYARFSGWEEFMRSPNGSVRRICGDIYNMSEIPTGALDAAIAVSALEHNFSQDTIQACAREMLRVVKSGGLVVSTSNTVNDENPSIAHYNGEWLMTDGFLRWIFDLPESCPSNFYDFQDKWQELLRDGAWRQYVPSAYYVEQGLTLEQWLPRSLPVGVVKVKK